MTSLRRNRFEYTRRDLAEKLAACLSENPECTDISVKPNASGGWTVWWTEPSTD